MLMHGLANVENNMRVTCFGYSCGNSQRGAIQGWMYRGITKFIKLMYRMATRMAQTCRKILYLYYKMPSYIYVRLLVSFPYLLVFIFDLNFVVKSLSMN